VEAPPISTQQLAYVVALAQHGSFGRAAAACFVSQPGLSTQIREVERKLGVALFERTPRGVLVTAAGEEVVRRARIALRDLHDLVESARLEADSMRGPLRLAIIPTLAPYVMPAVVATVTNRFPDVQLLLHDVRTDDLLRRLRDGEIDLGLIATDPDGTDLVTVSLGVDPFLVAVGAHHPLAGGRGPVSWEQLHRYEVLLLDEGHCLREQTADACVIGNLAVHDLHATSLTALVQMVAAGVGITLLPSSAASLEARPGNGVVVRRLRTPVPERHVQLVWRATTPRADAYRELGSLLRPALGMRRAQDRPVVVLP
jgi:LysR family transcriptional regulator, hydrogen peroxide-inducible genes activator